MRCPKVTKHHQNIWCIYDYECINFLNKTRSRHTVCSYFHQNSLVNFHKKFITLDLNSTHCHVRINQKQRTYLSPVFPWFRIIDTIVIGYILIWSTCRSDLPLKIWSLKLVFSPFAFHVLASAVLNISNWRRLGTIKCIINKVPSVNIHAIVKEQ